VAGHDRKKQVRSANVGRRLLVGMGAGAGVFFAAAAMATGATVTAAPAKADFEDLLDPIIQPILTSLTDSIGAFDPAAALDLASWTDSFASLNSIDLALPSAAEPAASAAVPAASDPVSGTYDIPITLQEATEPTVKATIDGTSNTLLVDTGSSGLVIPWESLGSNDFTALENLFELGSPVHSGFSGYSGGVEYFYLTYDTTVSLDGGTGLDAGNTPVDVEIFSYPTSFSSPFNFESFVADNDSTGILGVGDGVGPATASPLQADGYPGVTIDIPGKELVIGANAGTPIPGATFSDASSGAPITNLYESVNGGTPVAVSDDVDSGGVYGNIPSSLLGSASTVAPGTTISVYDNAAGTGTPLYTYQTGTDSIGNSTAPSVTSGTNIDSGIEPFLQHPIFIDYAKDSLTFDK
jgi:hypothetical protein